MYAGGGVLEPLAKDNHGSHAALELLGKWPLPGQGALKTRPSEELLQK